MSCLVGAEEILCLGHRMRINFYLGLLVRVIKRKYWNSCEVSFHLLKCFMLLSSPFPLIPFAKEFLDALCLVSKMLRKLA